MITKNQVLENLDEVKRFISEIDNKKEEKTLGIAIKNRFSGADLRGADLRDAELMNAKFLGRGTSRPLTKKQVPDFLRALGLTIED